MNPILSVKDLHVSRMSDSLLKKVLKGISFDLHEGELIDVVGPSGCGKSTLLSAIACMIPYHRGTILLDDIPREDFHPTIWRSKVNLLMQKTVVINSSVRDNLLLPWTFKLRKHQTPPPDKELRKNLDKIGLNLITLERNANELSGGEQSRISLIRSLLTEPRVLMLDETDAALDKETSKITLDLLLEYLSLHHAGIIRVQHHDRDNAASKRILIENSVMVEESQY